GVEVEEVEAEQACAAARVEEHGGAADLALERGRDFIGVEPGVEGRGVGEEHDAPGAAAFEEARASGLGHGFEGRAWRGEREQALERAARRLAREPGAPPADVLAQGPDEQTDLHNHGEVGRAHGADAPSTSEGRPWLPGMQARAERDGSASEALAA